MSDFLGLDKPLRPDRPTTLPGKVPGAGERPNRPGRPGPGDIANKLPDNRPDRPGVGNRPNIGARPGRPGNRPGNNRPDFSTRPDRWPGNNVISKRPSWANIGDRTNINIHNQWNNAFTRPARPGWYRPPGNRLSYWHGWGNGVRHGWSHYHHYGNWFNGSWWNRHHYPIGGWHYHYWRHNHGWNYWWTVPTWAACTNWFSWQAPATVWSEPVYYDYGSEGNVVYEDNSVYIGGTEVASAADFAASAMELATVEPPATEEEAEDTEWMPLGTWTVSTNEQDTDPSLVVQLAVNRDGIVSGTLYNADTDQSQSIQGQVDKKTQRVAIRFGENEELVAETGLYNLTQKEAPVLVHFGADRTEDYLLVQLEQPNQQAE